MPVYVQHEVLGKVNDVFNAETIWQAPGLALFSRRPLLRDLLERSPREQRGRAATRCFSHVTLVLAQDELDDDRHLTRGARVRDLAQTLKALHQKDFGDLLGSDDVRYDVVGADSLEPGQVEVRFGHAVYLPAAGESSLYTVETSRDSAVWKTVCPIYPQQRLALIGQDAELASHAVPSWPFGAGGAILLVNDGPDTPIEVQVRPKGAFECSYDAATGHYSFAARQANGAEPPARLLMKITRAGASGAVPAQASAPSARPAAVWKTRSPTRRDNGETALPLSHRPAAAPFESDATYAPVARQGVTLAALALPRLSRYHETGAVALDIGFDRALNPTAPGAANAISIRVDYQDRLHAVTAEGSQRFSAPASFSPVDASALRLLDVPAPMAERYCALLCLTKGPVVPLSPGARLAFGRGTTALAALRVLDGPRFLRNADGAETNSADRIGLSRTAFSFEPVDGGYRIARLSATQALFHLDDKLAYVGAIETGADEQAYLLPPGHHLVAGHYVLRFDA